ncbi:uncharacterized protein F4822DRAFT_425553 [Hypoxylon trugodes]|uniref:uncharacterized protein n=1 Tax=Hypoxylon trugodes TaxID=326681 RepID=UPI0021901D5C|nr:uncharacterized protein F4822DRAFT_425553 [Hypoxylon trugodes]KAI1392343.1 hypothetical protein F4822DRAFT_425553 [Hypoxylon trugodes]
MYARSIFTVLALATSALSSPVTPSQELQIEAARNTTCVLIGGDDPYIIDPFNRPQCACKCIIQSCQQPDPAQTEECLRTPWPYANGTTPFPDTIARYGACVGSTHCVG